MKVWLVFRETVRYTDIDSVWATEEDAARYAEDIGINKGIDTLIEPYEVRQSDGDAS